MEVFQLKEDLDKARQELTNHQLQWQEEKSSYQAQMDEQRAETNWIAAAHRETQDRLEETQNLLERTQDLLEAESHELTTIKDQREMFMNLCQTGVDKQRDDNRKLKEALHKAEQELKNRQLQRQNERSRYQAKAFCQAKTFYQARMDEQRAQTNRIAAALKETQDLLQTERHVQTTTKEEMEMLKCLCQATVDEQLDVNSKLKAAFIKAENELKDRHLLWQQEKSSLLDQNKKYCELYHTQLKITADFGRREKEAKQALQRFKAAHEGQRQLEEQRAESSKILAVVKQAEDQFEAERLRFRFQSSLAVQLEQTCRDLNQAQLSNIAALQTLEEETTLMVKRDQASQAQLEEQRAEINRLKAAWNKTEALLETEGFLWEQEWSSLLQATGDLQATEDYLQSQIYDLKKEKKKKKKWFKLF
ncbi:hypothetical protein VZT92_012841 [Zoarces viviparus]|uniref:Uncharacterized protein n=1 Tax=Zoarces viviparus TaxID=48416 RepID=A0AAW1F1X1_ZOAVI